MERVDNNNNQYFISMTDMLLGLLVIFLIGCLLSYFFSQSLEKARAAETAEQKALQAEERAATAEANAKRANAAAAQANARALEAENRANELQNILLSIDQTRIEILKQIKARLAAQILM